MSLLSLQDNSIMPQHKRQHLHLRDLFVVNIVNLTGTGLCVRRVSKIAAFHHKTIRKYEAFTQQLIRMDPGNPFFARQIIQGGSLSTISCCQKSKERMQCRASFCVF